HPLYTASRFVVQVFNLHVQTGKSALQRSVRHSRTYRGDSLVPQPVLAVVSVLGKDQKGVVAQFATYMADRGINIEDIEQRVVRGFFVMDMLVDLKDLNCDLTEIITGLIDLGRKIDMEVRVHLHSERRAKKAALLVSKEPHCLQKSIEDMNNGKVHGKVVCVLANHPDLGTTAREAGLEFALK